ncbi:IucA/IucC family protein [Paenibacillus sp. BR2-3]|uniref:IucA/IucC family protein n=1 Tax=Paenibacillus sp. BR2-3 TaxID=3048494 RepID=UPI0039777B06
MNTYLIGSNTSSEIKQTLEEQAERMVFCDLINAMFHENLLGFLQKGTVSTERLDVSGCELYTLEEGESYFYFPVDDKRQVMFRVHQQRFIQTYKISRLPVVLLINKEESVMAQGLHPIPFMRIFADSLSEEERNDSLPNLPDFLDELKDSIEQTFISLEAMLAYDRKPNDSESSVQQIERFSALRDRPFHPTSRAKRGWNNDEYRQYSPEYGSSFGLDWLAVRRDCIKASTPEDIASFILNDFELETLHLAANQAGVDNDRYILLPVHPWQMDHVVPSIYQEEMAQGICIPVIRGLGDFKATSSVRALSASGDGKFHVKVPIGIYSLGALRVLPPRYLHNGEKGQRLLQQVMKREPLLDDRLRLCSESNWWGFYEPDGDPFHDKPGHLACLIREYPYDLLKDKGVELITMSALAVVDQKKQNPIFAQMGANRFGKHMGDTQVLELFREIAHVFIETTLTCFRYGIMPEVHGQNVILILRNGRVSGLLLRDHDTIRLHLPWLESEGLADPQYIVKPGTPNSLVNETPEQLLSYFQTLGVQVNLYAIMDALSTAYSMDEALFWQEIKRVIHTCISDIDFPSSVRNVIEQQLLDSETWPTRLLLTPLLKRTGSGGGSMPAGVGQTQNPLQSLGVEDE